MTEETTQEPVFETITLKDLITEEEITPPEQSQDGLTLWLIIGSIAVVFLIVIVLQSCYILKLCK